jgi:hypothetical protein
MPDLTAIWLAPELLTTASAQGHPTPAQRDRGQQVPGAVAAAGCPGSYPASTTSSAHPDRQLITAFQMRPSWTSGRYPRPQRDPLDDSRACSGSPCQEDEARRRATAVSLYPQAGLEGVKHIPTADPLGALPPSTRPSEAADGQQTTLVRVGKGASRR